METTDLFWARDLAGQLSKLTEGVSIPPAEGKASRTQQVLARSIVARTRGYVERVVEQVNVTYEHGCYDACAVMTRRLTETLIIECFEAKKIDHKIKDPAGNFLMFSGLIDKTLEESDDSNGVWNLSQNAKKGLKKIKDKGDLSAHNRRYQAHRSDIDEIKDMLRVVTQELIEIGDIQRRKNG